MRRQRSQKRKDKTNTKDGEREYSGVHKRVMKRKDSLAAVLFAISVIIKAKDCPFLYAMAFRMSKNGCSKDTLVACPSIRADIFREVTFLTN
ncbi:hypothetical protein MF1_04130 [Bartonella quintana]|nr:hypothetical protein MF1_04130 [Bartonella quintana]